ncbi:MAG: tyrosine phosphatase family protein [Lentilitoribacter sp.]
MSYIVVCPLEDISNIAVSYNSSEMISLMSPGHDFDRPDAIDPNRHLTVGINDINFETDGLISPDEQHVIDVIEFARSWDQKNPLLIHCWFGVSRSPAAALISALAIEPDQDDFDLANRLREASPSATPNRRIIEIGDRLLNRGGKLLQAVNAIGRGREASQGSPFKLTLRKI